MATPFSVLARRIPMDRGASRLQSKGSQDLDMSEQLITAQYTHTHTCRYISSSFNLSHMDI